MIRWIFHFSEGHVISEDVSEEEDSRISQRIGEDETYLYLPSKTQDLFVNLSSVKLIVREIYEKEKIPLSSDLCEENPIAI